MRKYNCNYYFHISFNQSFHIWAHYAHGWWCRCQDDPNGSPEKTAGAFPCHVAEHHPASHWAKQLTWLRTTLCGGWCLRMVLSTPSGACQKRSLFGSYSSFGWVIKNWTIFTVRCSHASAVLGVVILSVRLSHAYFVTNPKNLPAIFLYHMKGQSF